MRVLVIEDEESMAFLLRKALQAAGHTMAHAATVKDGLAQLESFSPDVVLTDYSLPDSDGLDVIAQVAPARSGVRVLMMTGAGSAQIAVKAMQLGADDYLEKPFDMEELLAILKRIQGNASTERELKKLKRDRSQEALDKLRIYGGSGLQRVYEDLEMVSAVDRVTVLILGETGVGKEHVARLVHLMSKRSTGPFIDVNCAAIPETLLESELFGSEAGAYTDAKKQKKGLFEQAQGGTLFLDEVGEISAGMQAKLLKVLEEKSLRRVGGSEKVELDVRVVAATNRDLEAEVAAGRFRADLLYRLNVFTLRIPPLRERSQDVPQLAHFFFDQACRDFGRKLEPLGPELLQALQNHPWPGNVRELRNVVEGAVIRSRGAKVEARSVALPGQSPGQSPSPAAAFAEEGPVRPMKAALDEATRAVKRSLLARALKASNGNKQQAARMLEVDSKTLYNIMKELGDDFAWVNKEEGAETVKS